MPPLAANFLGSFSVSSRFIRVIGLKLSSIDKRSLAAHGRLTPKKLALTGDLGAAGVLTCDGDATPSSLEARGENALAAGFGLNSMACTLNLNAVAEVGDTTLPDREAPMSTLFAVALADGPRCSGICNCGPYGAMPRSRY